MRKIKKWLNIVLAALIIVTTVIPANLIQAETLPAAWPKVFSPYTNSDATPILDPGADEHPIDVDVTSGVEKGIGNLPSMYLASDGSDFFVRLRLKGNPYDRKGGFLSSVWLVKLAVNGQAKATIGLDGKSPHIDYVYVANADGTNVQKIYQTPTAGGNQVPGTKITEAENGQYFLDFQVPIRAVTDIAPEITASTPVKFFFGTSKAANLSVINKEWMNTKSSNGVSVSFDNLTETAMNEQMLTVAIDGGSRKEYTAGPAVTLTGTTSLDNGQVTLTIGGETYTTTSSQQTWSIVLPGTISTGNGSYTAAASVTAADKTATATQEVVIIDKSSTGMITVDGGAKATTNSQNPTISGTAGGPNGSKVKLIVDGVEKSVNANNGKWSTTVSLANPTDGKVYNVIAKYTNSNGNVTYATANQKLTYKGNEAIIPLPTVTIGTITGDATPTIQGNSTGASQVEVQLDNVTVGIITSGNDSWSVAIERPLSDGNHEIKAIAANSNGSTAIATATHTVTTTSITIDNGAVVTTNDNQPTIRGNTNASDGTSITVQILNKDTNEVDSYTTSASNGGWVFEYPTNKELADGDYIVTVKVGSATATQELTIDTKTTVHVVKPINGSTSTETKPTLAGTAEVGATVELKVTDKDGQFALLTNVSVTEDPAKAEWIYTLVKDLSLGSYTLRATASDRTGNVATDSITFTVTAAKVSIESVENVSKSVPNGTSLAEAKSHLGTQVAVTLENGSQIQLPITWSEDSLPNYDGKTAGNYVFTGSFVTLPDGVDNAKEVAAPTGTITVEKPDTVSIKSVSDVTKTVANGTSKAVAKDALGTTVQVELENGNKLEVPITWSEESSPSYDGKTAGYYVFTGSFGTLPDGIDNSNGMAAPTGTVTVEKPLTVGIQSVSNVTKTVANGTSKTEAKAALGTTVQVELEIGEKLEVPIIWSEEAAPSYDGTTAGDYVFKGSFGTLPEGIDNSKEVTAPTGTVTVENPQTISIKSVSEITKTVANGTSKTEAKSALGATVQVELENGEQLDVSITWSEESSPSYDGTTAGDYVFTGSFGTLPEGIDNTNEVAAPTGTVTVEEPSTVSIKSAGAVGKTVVHGTTKAEAKSALGTTVQVELENGEKLEVPITWSEDSSPSYNGDKAGVYVFTGSFGTLPPRVDNVQQVSAPTGTIKIFSNLAEIETYHLAEETKAAVINKTDGTIQVEVKNGTSVDSLTAQFTLSDHAQEVKVDQVLQVSGQTANDFTTPLLYVVTAEDGTEKSWTVTVTEQEKTAAPQVTGTVRAGNTHINGSSEPNAEISVKLNGQTIGTVTANDSGNWTFDLADNIVLSKDDQLSFTAQAEGKASSDAKEITVERALNSENQIISTQLGTIDSANNIAGVPAGTKVSDFLAGLVVSEYASVEIVDNTTKEIIGDQETTNVSSSMVIRVTTEDGSVSYHSISIVLQIDLQLSSDPKALIGDGESHATLKAVLKDEQGNPISAVDVQFYAEAGTLSQSVATTNEQGEATVTLTSPVIEGTETVTKLVKASVEDAKRGISATDELSITFQPPVIVGQVLDNAGHPISNALVWVEVDGQKFEALTDSLGNYSLTVPKGGQYTVYFKVITKVAGQEVTSIFTQEAQVKSTGKDLQYKPQRKVSGKLFVETRNHKIKTMQEMFPNSQLSVDVLNDPTNSIQATIDAEGKYDLTGFEPGKTYQVVFNIEMNGKQLAGKLSEITVGTDGQLIIQYELIDPFGLVTDSITGDLIEGADMKLYWADTELNKQNGRTPDTLVDLPELVNFPPNQNKNPQPTSDTAVATLDGLGNYAWMVFANGDYYITSEKDGYVTYDSRKDTQTNTVLGDSWIKDGIIHIGQTIMRYDIAMDKLPTPPPAGQDPANGDPAKEDPKNEDPAKEEPGKEEPSIEEPSIEEPADEEADNEDPTEEAAKSEPVKVVPPKQESAKRELPDTATQMYNTMLIGVFLIGVGIVFSMLKRRRNRME